MSSSLRLQAVVFDCDGILVDTEPLHYQAFQEVLGPLGLGHDYARYLDRYIGFDDRDAFLEAFREAGRPPEPGLLTRLIKAKEAALQRIILKGISTFPGVVELVRSLADRKVPLAVASGALRREVNAFIESLGLTGLFCVIVAADEVKRSKPDPETYLVALERMRSYLKDESLDPRACVAIEDTPAGIESAESAGLHVVGVTNSFPAEGLAEADLVVRSLAELDYEKLEQLMRRGNS